uniref:Uncharacterized protein LOC100179634 n=1 Tax=Phallusia mammillata TaxID=59560 RepID=A0A6F9DHQ9_9ASCI|nr:uncharacterized protein LOC100179634 [Phallusia mammillata]
MICNTQACPIWTDWTPWSACSLSCGSGTRSSERTCQFGKPRDVGCGGSATRSEDCNTQECPHPCVKRLDKMNFHGNDSIQFECPKGCLAKKENLWGSGIYTEHSSICAAAIHDGRIKDAAGGSVTVYKLVGMMSYIGILRNKIRSKPFKNFERSFAFEDAGGTFTVYKLGGMKSYLGTLRNGITSTKYNKFSGSFAFEDWCKKQADQLTLWKGTSAHFLCPPGCGNKEEINLWGSYPYTGDSYICAAALHHGVITDETGGPVIVTKTWGPKSYKGSKKNGITSKTRDGSCLKPFRVEQNIQ